MRVLLLTAMIGCGGAGDCPDGYVAGKDALCLQESDTDTDTDTDTDSDGDSDADSDADADTDADADADTDADVDTGAVVGTDLDGDGFLTPADCNDGDPTVHPGAFDVCGDGVDRDCAPACRFDSTVTLATSVHGADGLYGLALGDVTGDGLDDFVVAAYDASFGIDVFVLADGLQAGDIASQATYDLDGGVDDYDRSRLDVGDLTGDGVNDLITSTESGADVIPGPITSSLTIGAARIALTSVSGTDATDGSQSLADFDGDGQLDLAVGAPNYNSGAGAVFVLTGPITADRRITQATASFLGKSSSTFMGRAVSMDGDFDGDGIADVALGGNGPLWVMDGGLPGLYTPANEFDHQITNPMGGAYRDQISVSDTDGDGYDDLTVGAGATSYNPAEVATCRGPLPLEMMTAAAPFRVEDSTTGSSFGAKVDATRDLDGDGAVDLVVTENTTTYAAEVFYGPLDGLRADTDADALLLMPFASTYALLIGDADRDGAVDVTLGYQNITYGSTGTLLPGEVDLFSGGAP